MQCTGSRNAESARGRPVADGVTPECVEGAGGPPGSTVPGSTGRYIRITVSTSGRAVQLPCAPKVYLGRRDAAIGVLPDLDLTEDEGAEHGVSRLHAMLLCEGNQLLIADLGSRNGTLLNGSRLVPGSVRRLHNGDEVILGSLAMRVQFAEDVPASTRTETGEGMAAPATAADQAHHDAPPTWPAADSSSDSAGTLPDAVREFIDRYCVQLLDVRLILALYERRGTEVSFGELAGTLKCSLADLAVRLQPLVGDGIVLSRGPSTAVGYSLSAEVLEYGPLQALDSACRLESSRSQIEARLRQNARQRG